MTTPMLTDSRQIDEAVRVVNAVESNIRHDRLSVQVRPI